jgi:hypothetical protein
MLKQCGRSRLLDKLQGSRSATAAQAPPTATVMRFRILDNCSAVIREAVGLTRRSDTLVT